eukprot:m51a1_g4366 putative 1-pyrroline-5-carboxylate dehydrogenase (547) ;mRNA; r:294829-297218
MSNFSLPQVPVPENEPCRSYPPGSEDARLLKEAVDKILSEVADIPLIIGGKEVRSEKVGEQRCPGDHQHVLARYSMATKEHVRMAIDAALGAKERWERMAWPHRLAIFLRAADLASRKYRYLLNAACMLGQGKTVWQAEIDSCCEAVDFLRFNPWYAQQLYCEQPRRNAAGCWNREEYRPLEGFVWALTPFNFTAIGANLPTSPAMVGNVVVWKPASAAVLSNYLWMRVLVESGLPAGVINFLPGSGAMMADVILNHRDFAGLHFTGSTEVFEGINATISRNAPIYKSYPRVVGETGGKDFHFVHESADVATAVNMTLRSAFEYQGQKCSACSRAYVPDTMWPRFRELLGQQLARVRVGLPQDFSTFMTAVIDKNSFTNISGYIKHAKEHPEQCEVVFGGKCDDSKGWYVEPTVILCKDPHYKSMEEEIFGPVLSVHVYEAAKWRECLELVDQTSTYALTGAVFAQGADVIEECCWRLRNAAGNFYINDKCTGAVVGQQPFGGARKSGTNDKAGEKWNLIRWVSVRSIKENFLPLSDFGYPHMGVY